MRICIGDRMPAGTLYELDGAEPRAVEAARLFASARVVLFSCPGAFTTKSTQRQLPGYLERVAAFRGLGVDALICITVSDPWVMDAWGRACTTAGRIRMLSDPECRYHQAIGLEMDCLRMTLGWRSQRFSLLVEQGIVAELNVEQPGGYDVSDASVLLRQLEERGSSTASRAPT